jgi:hypothetical protein
MADVAELEYEMDNIIGCMKWVRGFGLTALSLLDSKLATTRPGGLIYLTCFCMGPRVGSGL